MYGRNDFNDTKDINYRVKITISFGFTQCLLESPYTRTYQHVNDVSRFSFAKSRPAAIFPPWVDVSENQDCWF